MAKTDVKLYSTNSAQKKITTTITNVNDNADNSTLLELTQKLNNFTTNSFNSADRVNTLDLATDPSPMKEGTIAWTTLNPVFELTNEDSDNYLLTIPKSAFTCNVPNYTIRFAILKYMGGDLVGKMLTMTIEDNQIKVSIPKAQASISYAIYISTSRQATTGYTSATMYGNFQIRFPT